MKATHACSAFFLLLITVYSCAQVSIANEQDDLEIIQVNASRLSNKPIGSVVILSREQIEQINPASTIELLKRLPHVDVSENGNAGGFSYVSIRGGEFNFTLVTIDGIAVNDTTNSRGGGFDFNQIHPAAIERVEVYKGGINSIYGGDAISGVINIVTRTNTAPEISFELGTHQLINANIIASQAISKSTRVLASLSTQNKKVSAFEELQSNQLLIKSSYQQKAFNFGALMSVNQTDVLGFTEDSGGELFANPRVAEKRNSEQWLVGLSGDYQLNNRVLLNTKLSWLNRTERIDNPGINDGVFSGIPASNVSSDYTRLELDLFATFKLSSDTRIVLGANKREQNGSNEGFIDFGVMLPVDYDFSQNTRSGYIEAQHIVNAITLEASARFDAPDDFDNETSLRLGASFSLNSTSEVFAVFNQGYKLPSFFALAHPLVGNSALQPERSDNIELGFSTQVSDSIRYSVVYFANQFSDLVDFDAALFTNVNRNKVNMSGLEIDTTIKMNSWATFIANARYLDIDAQAGVTLRKRPNLSANFRLELAYKNSQTSIFIDARDNILDSSIATGYLRLPGYASVGVSTLINISPQLSLGLHVQNALNKSFQDAIGFVNDQRALRASLRYRF